MTQNERSPNPVRRGSLTHLNARSRKTCSGGPIVEGDLSCCYKTYQVTSILNLPHSSKIQILFRISFPKKKQAKHPISLQSGFNKRLTSLPLSLDFPIYLISKHFRDQSKIAQIISYYGIKISVIENDDRRGGTNHDPKKANLLELFTASSPWCF